jgi:hypothetical protein
MMMKPTNGYFAAALLGTLLLAGCANGDVADHPRPHRFRVVYDAQGSSHGPSEADRAAVWSLNREEQQRNDDAALNDESRAQSQQAIQDSGT